MFEKKSVRIFIFFTKIALNSKPTEQKLLEIDLKAIIISVTGHFTRIRLSFNSLIIGFFVCASHLYRIHTFNATSFSSLQVMLARLLVPFWGFIWFFLYSLLNESQKTKQRKKDRITNLLIECTHWIHWMGS